jgi:uncharacterized protein YpuA (DUF1002 family)
MTQHAPLPVAGYGTQSSANVALVNQAKRLEEQVLRHLDRLMDNPETDKRWAAIARTNIEQGFMAANRAVLKPTRLQEIPE